MESSVQIRLVRENLALAMALWAAAHKGVITAGLIPNRCEVETSDGRLVRITAPFEVRDNQELIRSVNNQVRGAFAFSVTQTNRVLEAVFGNSPVQAKPSELRDARCILYLLSKTFSNAPMAPAWVCPPEYRQRFEIPSVSFVLDAASLNGKKVYWDDFGGLSKYLDLLEFCGDETEGSTGVYHQPVPQELPAALQPSVQEQSAHDDPAADAVELDSISAFVEARCLVDTREMTIAKALYDAYLDWCTTEGYDPQAQRSFGMKLTALGFNRRRRGRGKHWWIGIGLAASAVATAGR